MSEKCDKGICEVVNEEKEDLEEICYCFDIFRHHIRNEIQKTGKTIIPEFISAQVKAGNCRCKDLNPKGSCCLGDIYKAVKEIQGGKR